MTRKIPFAASIAASLFGVGAYAADLPSIKAAPPPPPPAVFTWTGFHVGFNSGYGGEVYNATVAIAAPGLGGVTTKSFDRASGWFAGGQIGYDYQLDNGLVVGLESDMHWSEIGSSHQAGTNATVPALFSFTDTSQKLEWFGTTRGRLGFAYGRLLPYVTGGVAYGETSASGVQALGAGLVTVGSKSETNVGWAAGAGLDVALSGRVSARAEYLYLQLPDVSGSAVGLTPPPFPPLVGAFSTGLTHAHLLRGSFNYRFGGLDDIALPEGDIVGGLKGMFTQSAALDWTGFYAGVTAGYGGGKVDGVTVFSQPGLAFSTGASNRAGGALAGGQIGYNYQFPNQVVLGLESDAHWSDVRVWHQATAFGGPNGFVFTDTPNAMTWFGTTRARLGYALGQTLAFVTGGVAYGEITTNGLQVAGGVFAGAGAQTRVGWTIGGGTEYSLTQNLSLKSDYLYVELDGVSGPALGAALPPFAGAFSTGRFGTHVTRFGLNWRWGVTGAPVVAKY